MCLKKLNVYCLSLSLLFWMVDGGSLPWPDFESGWLPIINGLGHVARLNIDHGLGEIPVLVDVSVKIKDHIFPASGFRPDHPKERSGPVVYIYDDMYVNVSTSPIEDPLYRIFPQKPSRYEGAYVRITGDANVRIRAWKQSSLPKEDFKHSGIMLKANTSKVSDSYAEVNHNLDELPCLVVIRMKMYHGDGTIMADGVGSSMQVFADVPDRTNAYLVYGYSNTQFRLWVDSSVYGAMHLGYPAPSEAGNTIKYATVGGLSYTYETKYKFIFWQPKYFDNESTIFIAESFGYGTNSEISHSESVYIQSWIYEENGGCPTPVIPNGFADTSINGTSTGAQARVRCYERFMLIPKKDYYIHDHEQNTITCHKFGYWENVPSCVPHDKEVDAECNPAVDKCRDKHAVCTLMSTLNVYKCACNGGYNNVNGRCKAQGKYLPKADYDSDWVPIRRGGHNWYLELEHGLGTVPMLVDVQVEVSGYVFHAIGFPPDQGEYSDHSSAVVYIYDESFINVSSFRTSNTWNANLMSTRSYMWDGFQYHWKDYGMVRAQAWKSESLPIPDLLDDSRVLRANSSTASDSFYELEHNLGEYPGLVVVRAKMLHNGSTFYADGVGSALNVFYNKPGKTNAFLVYGFSGESVRAWVDSSENGAIFDGRKHTKFDIVVGEAVVEIYAWKISTLTPFFTYMFSLEYDRFPNSVEFSMKFRLGDALNVAVAEIRDPTSLNEGYRFPSSAFLADKDGYRKDENTGKCIFGGFTYGYEHWSSFLISLREKSTEMLLYKSKNFSSPYHDTGALVCIPDSFGNGKYSEKAFEGIGILHSWINGDCGPPPEVENGFINTTINGTEVGAMAALECDNGYRILWDITPVCFRNMKWEVYSSCQPVECGTVEAPANGTMNVTRLTFGQNVTFECDVGFKLNGTDMIECLSTGNWSAVPPSCSVHKEEDNKTLTSRSVREHGCVMGILLAVIIYSFIFI